MRNSPLALALVAAALGTADVAAGLDEGWGKLYPTKDVYHCGTCAGDGVNAAGWANAGAVKYSFVKAGAWAYQSDYDRGSLDAAMDAYSDFIVAYNVYWPAGDQQDSDTTIYPYTWTTTTWNWAEGDGDIPGLEPIGGWREGVGFGFNPFNWTKGTAAYCMFGSQVYYNDTDNVPATGDETVDTVNSVGWTCPDGTPAVNANAWAYCSTGPPPDPTGWADSKAECILGAFGACGGGSVVNNSVGFRPEIEDDPGTPSVYETDWGEDVWKSVVLDSALLDDLRGDGRADVAGLGLWGTWDDWTNHWISTREDFDTTPGREYDHRPYLRLLVPGDATMGGHVDGADFTAWADCYGDTQVEDPPGSGQYRPVGWLEADFNDDGVVDGSDYTIFADHYKQGPNPPIAALPEPATLALLALGACLPLLRRRS